MKLRNGKISAYDKIVIRTYGNQRIFFHESPSKRRYRNEKHSLL